MTDNYQTRRDARLKMIYACLAAGVSIAEKLFVEHFFAKMPLSDLEKLPAETAAAIALSAFKFAQNRAPGKPKIRIFTPSLATEGWDSHRLVVELINDDMPFLVDSLSAEINRQGFTIYETLHPIISVKRDAKGALQEILSPDAKGGAKESLIHFELSPLLQSMTVQQVQAGLESALEHVRLAVADWPALMKKTHALSQALPHAARHFSQEEIIEAQDFLEWMIDRNFIFLGYAAVVYSKKSGQAPEVDRNSLLGISKIDEIPTDVKTSPLLIEVRKSDRKSVVHRAALMDVVIVKTLNTKGEIVGEHRIYGLFTSSVYYQSAEVIPFVRRKVALILKRSGFDPVSHDGKTLKAIMEFLPRDEMFQFSEEGLLELGLGILSLEAKPSVRVFTRRDTSGRFVSAMVFVPREYFSTELRKEICRLLEVSYSGVLENFYTQLTDSPLARLHLILRTPQENSFEPDIATIEAEIAGFTTHWSDKLRALATSRFGETRADRLMQLFSNGFPAAYITRYDLSGTLHDIDKMNSALEQNGIALELFHYKGDDAQTLHLKIYNPDEEIALSDILPTLEHMGLRVIEEQPFLITPQGGGKMWIRDVRLNLNGAQGVDFETVKPLFEETLTKIWRKEIEDDRFNSLILIAGLTWWQAELLRAYAKYLRQIGFTYGPVAIANTLCGAPQAARLLVALFEARFDPKITGREAKTAQLKEQMEQALVQVSTLAEDRILRRLMELIQASLRTNYYQMTQNGASRPVLSFKFNSRAVPELPRPVPHAEIFVYSARVEGIHLRGGKVARGGLRWSDRPEDFRTEILGLMKAQMVKNSVIVPVGSKGGFVVKQPPADPSRDAQTQEGIACYTLYLQGLLDITDNIIGGKVVPPSQVVRHDGDDPYLVVAADKGTATFSDIANGVSASYRFWLGDAFASGGSAGYDHKKMAITARGAWVSVTRHFREMGVDIAQTDFTAVGIGDMAGDVFGNGMLLSNRIKLVAAFNHMHIFLDPAPDTKASFAERQRLFSLPRSSWKDYDAKRISKGGGVFERSAKRIDISPQVQAVLGIAEESLAPEELIKAILRARVDLFWNGGIGTYVKAADETHDQVGDRANNSLRINGSELRAKVVGEGGNLGFTQKGRIEYARVGGRINTDAIDNSGGVDCSDHEVNMKIAFSQALGSGKITLEKRNALLARMTDEVARLVLRDNELQTLAITIAELQGPLLLESHTRLIQALEQQGLLDRALEFLPSDKSLAELKLAQKGLSRPELAVLLAYGKMTLYKDMIESGLPDEPYFVRDLARYFPKEMQKEFATEINAHPLKREIIATVMTNSLVNRAGITFMHDMTENTGMPPREIAAAYTIARDAFDLRKIWAEIEALENVSAAAQTEMYAKVNTLLERSTVWLLRHAPHPLGVEEMVASLAPAVGSFAAAIESMHSEPTRSEATACAERLRALNVPEALARRVAGLRMLGSSLDIISVAKASGTPTETVGRVYFDLGAQLKLGWLREYADHIQVQSHWDRMAVQSLIYDLYDEQKALTRQVVETLCQDAECALSVSTWQAAHSGEVARFLHFIDGLKARDTHDISALLVALRHIKMLK